MAEGFLANLGQGFQGAGAVLSDRVYDVQAQDRLHALDNVAKSLAIVKAKRSLDADTKFSEFAGGLQPSAMKDSSSMLEAVKGIPLDVLAESPRAQQFMGLASQMQAKEAAQEQKRAQIQMRYDQMDQQRTLAEERAADSRLSAEERARHNLAMETVTSQMRDFQRSAMQQNIDLRSDRDRERRERLEEGLLTDQEAKFMAGQYLSGDKSIFQNLGRGQQGSENIVRLRRAVHSVANDMGMKPEEITAKMAEFEGIKAGQRTLGTRTANIEMAVTEAQNIIPIALEASKEVDRSKYPTLNALQLAVQKGTGDEKAVRLAAVTNALINTYSRAISPTGTPTVHDKEHAREVIDKAYSQGQYASVVDLMKQEMEAARKSPGQVRDHFRDAVTGKTHGGKVLKFDAKGDPL